MVVIATWPGEERADAERGSTSWPRPADHGAVTVSNFRLVEVSTSSGYLQARREAAAAQRAVKTSLRPRHAAL